MLNKDLTTALMASISDIRAKWIQGEYKRPIAVNDGILRRLIRDLGWPIFEPRVVTAEFIVKNHKVNFALCHPPDKPVVLLKVINIDLTGEREEQQLLEHYSHQRVPIAILTDGCIWKLFYLAGKGKYADKLIYKADLVTGNVAGIADGLIRYLAYSAVKSGKIHVRAHADYEQRQQEAIFSSVWDKLLVDPNSVLVDWFEDEVEDASGVRPVRKSVAAFIKKQRTKTNNGPVLVNWIRLSEYNPPPRTPNPRKIRFWDGSEQTLRAWNQVLISTVEKLYKEKRLTARDCPIRSGRSRKLYSVHTQPVHPTGKKFLNTRRIEGIPLFVNINLSASGVRHNTKELLKLFGPASAEVYLQVHEQT